MSHPLSDPIKLERWRTRLAACIRPVNRRASPPVEGPRAAQPVAGEFRARADHDGLNAAWTPRYRRPEEIVLAVAPPGRLGGAYAGDWTGVHSMRIVMVGAGY